MRKIRLFFAAVVTLLGAAAVSSCLEQYEDRGNTPDGGLQAVEFGAAVTAVADYSATVHVSQTNCEEAGWFGFVTDDLSSAPATLVAQKVRGMNVTVNTLAHGDKDVELTGLLSGKEYRYIVTGLLANGVTYKDPVVVGFKTTGDFIYHSLVKDESIALEYKGTDAEATTLGVAGAPAKYGLVVVPAANVDIAAADEYILAYAEAVKGAAAAGTVSLSSFIRTAQGDVKVSPVGFNEEYVALCFGVTDNFNATGTYNVLEFAEITATYEDFLGEWDFTRTDGAVEIIDHLTISPEEEGKSYVVDGTVISGDSYSYVAEYEKGKMIVKSQIVDEWDHSKYGHVKDMLLGTVIRDGSEVFITGTGYTITDASIDKSGDAPVVTFNGGSKVRITSGVFELISLTFAGVADAGVFNYYGNEPHAYLPTTMVKTGEYVPSEGPSYDSYVGVWAYEDKTLGTMVPLLVMEDEKGKSFNMFGWQSLLTTQLPVPVDYVGPGLAGVFCSSSVPVASGVEMLGGSYTVLLLGTIVDEDGEGPVGGSYYGAVFATDGKGTGTVRGNVLTLSSGTKYTVKHVQYYFIDEDTDAMFTVATPDALPINLEYFGNSIYSAKSVSERISDSVKGAELVPVKGFKASGATSSLKNGFFSTDLKTAEFIR